MNRDAQAALDVMKSHLDMAVKSLNMATESRAINARTDEEKSDYDRIIFARNAQVEALRAAYEQAERAAKWQYNR